MSIKKAQAHINEAVASYIAKHPNWDSKSTRIRSAMNAKVHVLNISFNNFSINNARSADKMSESSLKALHNTFIKTLEETLGANRVVASIDAAAILVKKEDFKSTKCILVIAGNNVSIVGCTYVDIRSLLTYIAGLPKFSDTIFGKRSKNIQATGEIINPNIGILDRRAILELGHSGEDTPFAEKIKAVAAYTTDQVLKDLLATRLTELVNVQADLKYEFLNTSDANKLGTGIVQLVIQPRDINSKFSLEESAVYRKFLNDIQYYLGTPNIPGSNTLIEDGRQFANDKLLSIIKGTKVSSIKPHKPISGNIKLPSSTTKVNTTSYKGQAPAQIPTVPKASSFSLASLQQLLDDSLQYVISANMGNGTNNNILNYRTGRFAASAKVERLSQSRAGMITAYYSYMKYPYQTFEPGFAQGSPQTRDPKLLIAKSIREIAATKVGNRMRAVSI